MEEKDKWIKDLRTRMEDYSESAPADLWNQLEKELDTPYVIPMWRHWQVAVAVVLLLAVSSLTVWLLLSPSADYMEQRSAEVSVMRQPDGQTSVSIIPNQQTAHVVPSNLDTRHRHAPVAKRCAVSEEAVVAAQDTLENISVVETQTEEISSKEQKDKNDGKTDKQKVKKRTSTHTSHPDKYHDYAYVPKKRNRNWVIGVSAGNGTFSSSSQISGYLPMGREKEKMMSDANDGIQSQDNNMDEIVQFANLADGETGNSNVKYRMPVTVGLSFRFAISDNWAIETGAMYTLLSSETTSGAKQNNYGREEKLHYIGIPLRISRNIWGNKRFDIYVSAGGAVEKCVSGKQKLIWNTTSHVANSDKGAESGITVKRLQWSLTAAAGAQYKITDKLGVYAEPGMVYYFDDGSKINTVRKEHPFNFNIQLGLRLTLSK